MLRGIQKFTDGVLVGLKSTSLVGFFGATRVTQPSGATQAAVTATPLTGAAGANPTQAEYATVVAQVNALTVLVNKQRADLVSLGLIKGSA